MCKHRKSGNFAFTHTSSCLFRRSGARAQAFKSRGGVHMQAHAERRTRCCSLHSSSWLWRLALLLPRATCTSAPHPGRRPSRHRARTSRGRYAASSIVSRSNAIQSIVPAAGRVLAARGRCRRAPCAHALGRCLQAIATGRAPEAAVAWSAISGSPRQRSCGWRLCIGSQIAPLKKRTAAGLPAASQDARLVRQPGAPELLSTRPGSSCDCLGPTH